MIYVFIDEIQLPYNPSQTPGYRPLKPIAQPPHILDYALVCDRTAFLVMGLDGKCGPGFLRTQCARKLWSVSTSGLIGGLLCLFMTVDIVARVLSPQHKGYSIAGS